MNWNLGEIAHACKSDINPCDSDRVVQNISTDTRALTSGSLFLALKGPNFDGHDFIQQAIAAGAQALVLDRNWQRNPKNHAAEVASKVPILFVADTLFALGEIAAAWRQQFKLPVLAITGSNGKTTTRSIAGQLLAQKFNVHQSAGNFNNLIGLPRTIFDLESKHEAMILEMGMNQLGEIARLTQIAQPTHALITNIGRVHLEGLGNIETVAQAKMELFAGVNDQAMVFINNDDPFCRPMADQVGIAKTQRTTFGWQNPADIMIRKVTPLGEGGLLGSEVEIEDRVQQRQIGPLRFPLAGSHNVYNLLAAASCALRFGVSDTDLIQGVANIQSVGSRTRILQLEGKGHILDDCYNANPSSMIASLHLFRELRGEYPGFAVLGEMLELGEVADQEHERLGKQAVESGVDHIFAVGEHASAVAQGAKKAGMRDEHIHRIHGGVSGKPSDVLMAEIAEKLNLMMNEKSWVLIKGSRGMALERIIAALKSNLSSKKKA